MDLLFYFFVFLASILVDLVPLIGPPAWTVMVFFQIRFDLNIWAVLVTGVIGSAIGRYLYSAYIPYISDRLIKPSKNADLQFMGQKLGRSSWKVNLFVFVYTLMPLPSTPLFTAAGIARVRTIIIIPSFLAGKFISDAVMVMAGNYVVSNTAEIGRQLLSWKSLSGIFLALCLLFMILFIDWWKLLVEKKFRIHLNIWR